MKALRIKNAPQSFGMFLIAKQTPFRYDFGDFIIEDTWHSDKFVQWCLNNGVSEDTLSTFKIEVVVINCDVDSLPG